MIFSKRAVCLFFVVLALLVVTSAALVAQTPGSLTGHVFDPSGAAVPGATVTLTGPNGVVKVAQSDNNGAYSVVGLPPGDYTIRVISAGFDLFEGSIKGLPGGRSSTFDAKMAVAAEKQEVTVKDTQTVELDPAKNSSALVLKEADLDMLSDDPDDLQADLLALAGPAAGPNGGQIFIDGFSSGQLPPKDSIREIRINSNPYSAEYDTQGHGRIEIFTKPGSDKFHGSVNLTYSDHIWNARNPFDLQTSGIPASDTKNLMATLSGPINKKASFFLDFSRRELREAALVNAFLLDPNFNIFQQSLGIIAPTTNTRISPRVNYQLTSKITLDARYVYSTNQTLNSGVSGTNLQSTGNTQKGTNQQFFLTETMVVNTSTINESRFQYFKNNTNSVSNDPMLNISVGSAFTSGGNYFPNYYNNQGNYELQNYTSITHGTQFIKFGARLRETRISNLTTAGFAGQFNFASIDDYQAFEQGLYQGTSLNTLLAQGVGPIQFQLNAGPPAFSANQFDAGLFFQDDWKLVPSMTLSLGLRYEVQNNISDHGDWAPRIGYAWGLGGGTGRFRQPKTVLRAGAGYFYDRFSVGNVLNADRYSGVDPGVKSDQSFTITNPNFFPASAFPAGAPTTSAVSIPSATQLQALSSSGATTYLIDPHLHVPTQLQSAVGVDRQLPHNISLSVNYLYTRGSHTLENVNINTPYNNPLTGNYTYVPAPVGGIPSGLYPFGYNAGIINEYSAEGVYRQDQFIINSNARVNARFSLFGYYVYGHANTDASGSSSNPGSPSNPYYLKADYGRAPYDYRNQANINGSIIAPLGIRLSPNIGMRSAGPYNITSGLDDLGTSVINQRPAFLPAGANIAACSGRPVAGGPPCVANGFVENPTPGMTIIPVNYGKAFPNYNVNLRISRTWGFGEKITSTRPPRGQGDNGQPGGGRGPGFGQGAGPRGGGGGGGRGGGGGPGPGGFGMGDASGKKFTLTASMMFHNLFNYVNQGSPIGSVISPEFGQVTSLSGGGFGPGGGNAQAFNRRIDFSLRFSF